MTNADERKTNPMQVFWNSTHKCVLFVMCSATAMRFGCITPDAADGVAWRGSGGRKPLCVERIEEGGGGKKG